MAKRKMTARQRRAFWGQGGYEGIRLQSASKSDVDSYMESLLEKGEIVLDGIPEDDDTQLEEDEDFDSEICDYDEDGAEL